MIKRFSYTPLHVSDNPAFREASAEELRVLLFVIEAGGITSSAFFSKRMQPFFASTRIAAPESTSRSAATIGYGSGLSDSLRFKE